MLKIDVRFNALIPLLKVDERSVRLAAGEGIVVVFERASINASKFDDGEPFEPVGGNLSRSTYEDVIHQMKDLSIEAGGKGTSKKELGSQRSFFYDVLAYIEVGFALLSLHFCCLFTPFALDGSNAIMQIS